MEGLEEYDLGNTSFYGLLLREYGVQVYETQEELLLVEAKREEKRLLGLEGKCEILLNRGTSYVSKMIMSLLNILKCQVYQAFIDIGVCRKYE